MDRPAPPWPRATQQDLLELMAGNEDAVKLVRDIVFWSHRYDDLVDGDPVTAEDVHRVMYKLLVALPMNPFYRQHEDMFRGVILTGVLDWLAANQMQESGELEELRIAHVIRYSICGVAMLAMTLTGGYEHAMKNARRCRLLSQYDTWDHYLSEHTREGTSC